ncbi:hypothetical protein HJC23_010623 [Cyclotella cryptica]|uniref:Peptidase A1 domain-containing protein n=1 Tax=Cyclotella cryptica TaxID=29204 RepID=A0ABD3NRP6_9STRA|eukprot:CCRYP_020659-RA/>CCRYP_020659-RA protein AED:0.00 eAED:0.00 QI:4/-1/1/1/-1/1/1/179/411
MINRNDESAKHKNNGRRRKRIDYTIPYPSALPSMFPSFLCLSTALCVIHGANAAFSCPPRQSSSLNSLFSRSRGNPSAPENTLTSTALHAIQWPSFLPKTENKPLVGCENGLDPSYPWRFEGRFIFRPSLVRVPIDENDFPPCSTLVSIFGYTLGGSVVLEYDVSPVGPYREYVNMGGVVALGRVGVDESLDDGNGAVCLGLGQWGTNLYVSTQVAEDVCQDVWGVPATLADIVFDEDGHRLLDGPEETSGDLARRKFNLSGWNNARILSNKINSLSIKRFGNIPIFWTPTIKALWAPISFPFQGLSDRNGKQKRLPVHKLRLSASALRLKRCDRISQQSTVEKNGGEIPLGLALVVDNVLIEIGRRVTTGNLSILMHEVAYMVKHQADDYSNTAFLSFSGMESNDVTLHP